ncbi:hypothetical protein JCM5296_001709 [Sporobolomyces johnsonii]
MAEVPRYHLCSVTLAQLARQCLEDLSQVEVAGRHAPGQAEELAGLAEVPNTPPLLHQPPPPLLHQLPPPLLDQPTPPLFNQPLLPDTCSIWMACLPSQSIGPGPSRSGPRRQHKLQV